MVLIERAGIKEKYTNVKLGCFSMVLIAHMHVKDSSQPPLDNIIKTMKNNAE